MFFIFRMFMWCAVIFMLVHLSWIMGLPLCVFCISGLRPAKGKRT